ncbi:MAG: hypothetical protein IJ165_00120 [Proteobacteria bacterium]|nr:hypothetical protein [Pseudomonadota bacterium]
MRDRETSQLEKSGKPLFSRLCMLVVLGIFCMLCACGEGPVWTRDDPRTVLSGFLTDAEYQDMANVWEYLSAETRQKLDQMASAFNASAENGSPRKGYEMLRTGHLLSSTREYRKIELVSSDDTSAELHIILHDETYKTVTLHREEGRWAIDLPI